MTREIFNVLVIATLLTFASAVQLQPAQGTIKQTFLIEKALTTSLRAFKDSAFAGQVKTLIALSLSKGQYDELFGVLSSLYKDLLAEKKHLKSEWTKKSALLGRQIQGYKKELIVARQEMATAQRIKTAAEKKVRTLKKEKKNLEKIIKSLYKQMKTLTTSHDTDVKKTKARVAAHQDTIKALRIIIRDLGDISRKYPTGKTTLFELKEVVGKISQISKKNPLLALMELSTTFNPATLNTVISKLNAIKEKMAASVADDLEDQKLASAYFQRLYSSLDKSKTASDTRLGEVMVEYRSEQAKVVQATEDFKEAVADRNRARSLLSKKMFEFTTAKNAYAKDLAGVNEELEIVEKAQKILVAKLGYVK